MHPLHQKRSAIFGALETLYGASTAAHLRPSIHALMETAKARLDQANSTSESHVSEIVPQARITSLSRQNTALSERDALLICYADQVREAGVAPLRSVARFARGHLRGLISGLHLLPFYPWSSDDGFAVQDYYSVDARYGSWEDIGELGMDFDLMFDAVVNHASAQGEWFRRFLEGDPQYRDFFVTVSGSPDLSQVIRPRTLPLLTEFQTAAGPRQVWTTFSPDQVDLNFKNPTVLLSILDVLLFYVAKGARFLRLDAIAFLWKEIGTRCLHLPQTHIIIQLFRAVLNEVAPQVQLITETNVPHAENISYFGNGSNEAQLVYNFALPPLVLHSFQTGDARKLTRWAQSLVLPSAQATFFNFLASHDGIGLNPARGILSEEEIDALAAKTRASGGFVSFKTTPDGSEVPYELNINYLDALAPAAAREQLDMVAQKFLAAQAIMLSLQGVPGIYFHSLFGSRGDPAAVESSGIKRRVNREKLARISLESELRERGSLRARVFQGFAELLRRRRALPAFSPAAGQVVLELDPRVFAVRRQTADGASGVLCLHNVSSEPVVLPQCEGHDRTALSPFGFLWLGQTPG